MTAQQKQFSWFSLALLLLSYTWFGWYLCGLPAKPLWLNSVCHRVFGDPLREPLISNSPEATPSAQAPADLTAPKSAGEKPAEASIANTAPEKSDVKVAPEIPAKTSESQPSQFSRGLCSAIMRYNILAGVLAVGWIIVSSIAFISPLTTISNFINRWFQSDTVAFLTIFMLAGLASVILYWLHIFLQITTILAVDILARIDIQYAGFSGAQAFWILTLTSFAGLVLGWTAKALFINAVT